jgi:hypothetical protein
VDFDQYVAARYGRLIEHAVLLGCAEGEAGACVDRVLLAQRKRIRRAEDPDPLVREALEREIAGPSRRSGLTGPLVALGLVTAVGVALTYRPPAEPVPSLFALDADQAQQLLEGQGYDVLLRPARSCEPPGLVVGADPPIGGPVGRGGTVTVRTSVLSGSQCEPSYPARSAAWDFIKFALGRAPAPQMAGTVRLLVSGSIPRTLAGNEVAFDAAWGEAFDLIAAASTESADTDNGMPVLRAEQAVPPARWCGVTRPQETAGRAAVRFQIDPTPRADDGCPLTVDLYRTADGIDTVVVYTPKPDGRPGADEPGDGPVAVSAPHRWLAGGRAPVVWRLDMVGHHDGLELGPRHEHQAHRQERQPGP